VSLERTALARAVATHGPVVRVVVADVKGSAPREAGAAMLVWAGGQAGTIGGGTLEYDATLEARAMLAAGEVRRITHARLGPDLGQCCGGAVALVFELFDAARLAALGEGWLAARDCPPRPPVWIWGAGHVGRALVATLAPLPGLALSWIDTAHRRLPDAIPDGVTTRIAERFTDVVADAPAGAHHLVLSYSHALDLALCNALLTHGFASAGLIGSDTKWARFRTRLGQMGHAPASIARIRCPIGDKALGKHPQAIAVGVAYALLMDMAKKEAASPSPGDWEFGDDGRAVDA